MLFNNCNQHAQLLKKKVFILHFGGSDNLNKARNNLRNVRNTAYVQRLEDECDSL